MPNSPRHLLSCFALIAAIGMIAPLAQATDSAKTVRAAHAGGSGKSAKAAKVVKAVTRRSTRLARADRDGSGTLSRDEVRAGAPRWLAQFDAIDADHDDQLSPQEIRAWSRSHAGQRSRDGQTALATHFARADADGNGLLSHEEASAHLPRVAAKFDRIDANRDGAVTADEFGDYLETRRAKRPDRR